MQIPTFGTAAPKLAENGYQPVPIHWRKKNPCAGKEWQNYVFAESDCSRLGQLDISDSKTVVMPLA